MLAKFKRHQSIILILLLAAILRLLKLTFLSRPIWYDETFTAWLAQLTPTQLIAATAGDIHPPLYYLVEWFTVRLIGTAPWALRFPSAIFGLIAVGLAYRLFILLQLPLPVTTLATLGMAILPAQLHYSQDARMYSMLLALSLWAAIEIYKNHFGRFAVVSLLMIYTHSAAAFTLAGLGLWWLVRYRATTFQFTKQWLLVVGIIVVGYAPWANIIFSQARTNWWLQGITTGIIFQTLDFLFWFEGIQGFYTLHTGVLAIGLLLSGWWLLIRHNRADLLVPPLGAIMSNILVSLLVVPVFLHRSFIGITPWLYLAAAWAMWQAWLHLPRLVTYLGILPVLLLGVVGYQIQSIETNEAAEKLAITAHFQPDDICYHFNVPSLIFFRYYVPHCNHWLWPDHLTSLLNEQGQAAMGMQRAYLSDLPVDWTRAWLFVNDDPFSTDPTHDAFQRHTAETLLQQQTQATEIIRTNHRATVSHWIKNDLWLIQKAEPQSSTDFRE